MKISGFVSLSNENVCKINMRLRFRVTLMPRESLLTTVGSYARARASSKDGYARKIGKDFSNGGGGGIGATAGVAVFPSVVTAAN